MRPGPSRLRALRPEQRSSPARLARTTGASARRKAVVPRPPRPRPYSPCPMALPGAPSSQPPLPPRPAEVRVTRSASERSGQPGGERTGRASGRGRGASRNFLFPTPHPIPGHAALGYRGGGRWRRSVWLLVLVPHGQRVVLGSPTNPRGTVGGQGGYLASKTPGRTQAVAEARRAGGPSPAD